MLSDPVVWTIEFLVEHALPGNHRCHSTLVTSMVVMKRFFVGWQAQASVSFHLDDSSLKRSLGTRSGSVLTFLFLNTSIALLIEIAVLSLSLSFTRGWKLRSDLIDENNAIQSSSTHWADF